MAASKKLPVTADEMKLALYMYKHAQTGKPFFKRCPHCIQNAALEAALRKIKQN